MTRLAIAGLFTLALAACGSSGPPAGRTATADPQGVAPQTIPALRNWQPGAGAYVLSQGARISVESAQLRPVAEVLLADLAAAGHTPAIVDGGSQPGDIVLSLGEPDPRVGTEGYRLDVGTTFTISAATPAGVFYGTRSLLQWLRSGDALQAGTALDWPRYPQRGMMVDAGRKYFSPAWFERHVRELAWLKMNTLHLHFSDNEGFRIESLQHPEIVSAEHLTQEQVRAIVALAQRYFVTVLPEIDMPGHLGAVLAAHPEFALTNLAGQPSASQLDITNPEAVAFARSLIAEFLPLFPGRAWHTGGDEYLTLADQLQYPQVTIYARDRYGPAATAKDAIHGFLNDTAVFLRERGKDTVAWHDDLGGGNVVAADPAITAEWWTNFSPLGDLFFVPTPQALVDAGHRVINSGWFPTYYVQGGAFGAAEGIPPVPDMATAYEDWAVHEFYGPLNSPVAGGTQVRFPPDVLAPDEPANLGSMLNIWSDDPAAQTEDEVAAGIFPILRVIAQKTWESPLPVATYAEFEGLMADIGTACGSGCCGSGC